MENLKLPKLDLESLDYSKLQINEQIPLGKRVEYFFEFYINSLKDYELIQKNIQIIKNKNTLGEIDFIIYDKKEDKYIHTELVYKFYLYDLNFGKELDRYIGPNRNDSLLRKTSKLKDKQLPLLHKEECKNYFESKILENIEQKLYFKANVYLPYKFNNKNLAFINNCSIRGFYINRELFISENAFRDFSYNIPHRYDWIVDEKDIKDWICFEEALKEIDFFLNLKKSPLVFLKNTKQGTYESFFVTWW